MAAEGANPKSAAALRSFVDLLVATPQPIPDVNILVMAPKVMDGQVFVLFSKEILKLAELFWFSLVLYF